MEKLSLHIESRQNGHWAVRRAGAERATKVFPSKREALTVGRSLAQKSQSELFIHRIDGMVEGMESYNPEPLPSHSGK